MSSGLGSFTDRVRRGGALRAIAMLSVVFGLTAGGAQAADLRKAESAQQPGAPAIVLAAADQVAQAKPDDAKTPADKPVAAAEPAQTEPERSELRVLRPTNFEVAVFHLADDVSKLMGRSTSL
jgi:hypothetical protein